MNRTINAASPKGSSSLLLKKQYLVKGFLLSAFIFSLLISCATPNDTVTTPVEDNNLVEAYFYETQGYAMDISVTDSIVYIAEDQAGFSIYNLNSNDLVFYYDDHSNFQNYRLIHADEANEWLFIYNRYGNTSIQAFDIANIDTPTVLPPIIGQTQKIEKIAFEENPDGGLILSWINEGPKFTYGGVYNGYWQVGSSNFEFDYSVVDFDTDSTYLYIACEQLGVQVLSRDSGIVQSSYNTIGEAIKVRVDGNLVYIADKQEGLSVIDFSDLENPILLYQYDTSGYAQSIDFDSDRLVVGSGGGGVYLFDISDKQNIQFVERYDPSDFGYTYKVVLKDDKVFVATKKGVYELEIQ